MNNNENIREQYRIRVERPLLERILAGIGKGFMGLALLTSLPILSVTFILIGIALPIISFMNLFGIIYLPFNILFYQITGIPQVFLALILGALFVALGYGCFMGLKWTLKTIKAF